MTFVPGKKALRSWLSCLWSSAVYGSPWFGFAPGGGWHKGGRSGWVGPEVLLSMLRTVRQCWRPDDDSGFPDPP